MRLIVTVRLLPRSGAVMRVGLRDGEKHWHLGTSTALPEAVVSQQLVPAYRAMAHAHSWTFQLKQQALRSGADHG